ncbi:MAG: MBL fold metallo-hydrolase, partial [Myxococcales bacterium]|nr:MBL fold metallo-hydrolase [Myxococcales bacterium]
GHLVFRERASGLAYAGDLVAGEGTILIDPADAGDMAAYLASLERIAAIAPRALIPAHGPVITAPEALLRRYIDHRRMREDKILAAVGDQTIDLPALLARVYDDTPRALWPLAERSLEAHLGKLVAEGRLHRDGSAIRRGGGAG